jgi:hypothetical protein
MAKRETNTQRRAREDERRVIYKMARGIIGSIVTRRCSSSLPDAAKKSYELCREFEDSALFGLDRTCLDAKWVESQSVQNIAKALRMAADMLDSKPSDGRSYTGHDTKIFDAFLDASGRVTRNHPHRVIFWNGDHRFRTAVPTFDEFLEVYREQNPRTSIEERTLRRSLRRLGLTLCPARRGRPNKNSHRKTPLIG